MFAKKSQIAAYGKYATFTHRPEERAAIRMDYRGPVAASMAVFLASGRFFWFRAHPEQKPQQGDRFHDCCIKRQGDDESKEIDQEILDHQGEMGLHKIVADENDDGLVQDIERQHRLVGIFQKAVAEVQGLAGQGEKYDQPAQRGHGPDAQLKQVGRVVAEDKMVARKMQTDQQA